MKSVEIITNKGRPPMLFLCLISILLLVWMGEVYAQGDANAEASAGRKGDLVLEDIVVKSPRVRRRPRQVRSAPTPPPEETTQPVEPTETEPTPAEGPPGPPSGPQTATAGPPASGSTLPPGFRTGDVNLEQTSASYSVIERDQFEGKMEDLAEVIERESGVQVRQQGGFGSFSTVSLRGSSSDQVMIFMDGILLNDASGGGVNLGNISLGDVESIEMFRGVTPANFGKASIGGVVNIKTLRAQKGFNSSFNVGYGSFNTQKYSGFINHKPGKWDYLVSADFASSDNNYEFRNDMGTEWNKDDDRIQERKNAQFRQYNVLLKTGYDFTKDFRIDLVNQWFSKDQGLPNWNNTDSLTSLETKRNLTTAQFTLDNLTSLKLNSTLKVHYMEKEEEYDDRNGDIGLGKQHSRYNTDRLGTGLFVSWPAKRHQMNFNVDYFHETYKPKDLLGLDNPHDSKRDFTSMCLQDSVFFFDKKLIVTPAMRYTFFTDDLRSGTDKWGRALEGSSRDDDYWNPQLGVKYNPLKWLTLRANIAQYVREPSFFELFGDRGFFLGNDQLKPEKGVNYDVGFEVNLFPKSDLLSRLSFKTNYFASDVEDLITRVYDARGVGQSVNISGSFIYGVETGFTMDFAKYFSLTTNFTWQNPTNESNIAAFNGKRLPGRYERSMLTRLVGRYEGFKAYTEVAREEGIYYDTANLVLAPSKTELNAGVSYLYKNWMFSFDAKNLEDAQYEDFNGYPMPGRSYYFSVKYDFQM